MKRKIIAMLLLMMLCVSVCSCGKLVKPAEPTPPPIVEVMPSTLLTINEACEMTKTTLVQEGGIEKDGAASYVMYRGEPVGAADTVKISVEQYTAEVTKESIKQKFDTDHTKRTSAEDVEGIENCFIAYPTAYYYKDGYYLKITAGSGNDDTQKKLLTTMIQSAAQRLDSFITVQ